MSGSGLESLLGLEQFLVIVSTATLSYDELDPPAFTAEIRRQFHDKRLQWNDGQWYLPNIIHIFVPPRSPRQLEELEAIFNSRAFFQPIYDYVAETESKLFDFLRVEIDVLPGVTGKLTPGGPRCLVRMEWPNSRQSMSGFDVIVEANAARIIKVSMPKAEISRYALLQPINARTYREHYLIIKKVTHLGRARNVIGTNGELRVINEFAFARTSEQTNKSVSRIHARIEFRDDNFYLIDCGSRRGSAIQRFQDNWQETIVPAGDEAGLILEDHDIIRLGSALVSFEFVDPEQLRALEQRLLSEGKIDTGMLRLPTGEYERMLRSFARYINRVEMEP